MQKSFIKLSKIWFWDPGSGKNLFRIPKPGVKKAPDPGTATLPGTVAFFAFREEASKKLEESEKSYRYSR
jgi:hypothetical protein